MLDRYVVEEFLDEEFKDLELEIPKGIDKKALVEVFCQYTEGDHYEWLKDNFKSFFKHELEIPKDIDKKALVEAFCQYTEGDTYEWLKDNFKSFFNHGDPDWEWIKKKIQASKVEHK